MLCASRMDARRGIAVFRCALICVNICDSRGDIVAFCALLKNWKGLEGFMDARLAWLSRRGIKELDLVLQGFLQDGYADATAVEQQAFAALLEYQDPEILDRIFHGVEDEDAAIAALVQRLRAGGS